MSMPRFVPGFRLPWGDDLNQLSDAVDDIQGNGTAGPIDATDLTVTGDVSRSLATKTTTDTFQSVTAAGATQGNATLITGSKAVITVSTTASTHGVRLPSAATGLEVLIANAGTFGVKVYPSTNDRIGAASTNAAGAVLAINKATRYIAISASKWVVQVGA